MSNKKTIRKTNTKKNKEALEQAKKIEEVGEFKTDFKNIIWVVGGILVFFLAFYLLTLYLTNRGERITPNKPSGDGTISYTDIMAGRSFSMPEKEYLVVYYDREDAEVLSSLSLAVSGYRSKEEHLTIYTVDMSSSFNKGYISEESNSSVSNVSELKINGPTLIHFKDGSVSEYVEGKDQVVGYLE